MTGTDGLFYIDAEDQLRTMVVTRFEAEEVLQALLSRHPDLLAGGQMDPHEPRRWALVAREHGIPDREGASATRWSLDHLFVDQDAIPTLVEVKRSTDTRIRREVVGQLLDYAANGVLYWPVDRLRQAFTSTQHEAGLEADTVLQDLTEADMEVESFFDKVHENLRAGRVRLVFVADAIPDELQRIVEFLNTQMSPAEVFAVEVKQYAAEGFAGRTIVPRVIGRTANAMTKQGSGKALLTAQEHRDRADPITLELAERLADWAISHGLELVETRQARTVKRDDRSVVARLYYGGTVVFNLATVRQRRGDAHTEQLTDRLQAVAARPLTGKWPAVPVADVAEHWPSVLDILEEML